MTILSNSLISFKILVYHWVFAAIVVI